MAPGKLLQTIYDWRPEIEALPGRRRDGFPEIRDELFWSSYERAKPYSMLQVLGFFNLYQSVNYVIRNRIPGAFVECGSFLGGASIFMYLLAREQGDERSIFVFDTFAGFPPGQTDVRAGGKEVGGPSYVNFRQSVQSNFEREVGDTTNVTLVEGDVVATLPRHETGEISILRLDTDFHASTRAELDILYPRLVPDGVLIVDDYGTFEGSRRATDDYFAAHHAPPLLNRISAGIWAGHKPGNHEPLSGTSRVTPP